MAQKAWNGACARVVQGACGPHRPLWEQRTAQGTSMCSKPPTLAALSAPIHARRKCTCAHSRGLNSESIRFFLWGRRGGIRCKTSHALKFRGGYLLKNCQKVRIRAITPRSPHMRGPNSAGVVLGPIDSRRQRPRSSLIPLHEDDERLLFDPWAQPRGQARTQRAQGCGYGLGPALPSHGRGCGPPACCAYTN